MTCASRDHILIHEIAAQAAEVPGLIGGESIPSLL